MHSAVSVTLILLLSCSINVVTGKVYFITPSNGSCKVNHGDTCLTLSQFADSSASYVDSTSSNSLHLLPGEHFLGIKLKLANVQRFEMLSSQANSSKPIIVCNKSSRFDFYEVNHLLVSDLEFRGCEFTITNSIDQQEIVSATFIGNEDSGTVLTVSHSNLIVSNSSFISNTVGSKHGPVLPLIEGEYLSNSTYVGGAIVATRESNINISDCNFSGNSAPLGGAIFAEQGSQIIISRSRFTGIGHYDNFSNSIATARKSISLAVVLNSGSGGAVFLHNSSLIAYQCAFLEHSAQRGGAIFAYESIINLNGCNLTHNVAGYSQNTGMDPNVTRSNSAGTVAGSYGGALYTLLTDLSIDGCVFTGNEAYNQGGVIYAENGSVRLYNSTASHNVANQCGGVVFTINTILNVSNSMLSHNMANDTGGAIHASFRTSMSEAAMTFADTAAVSGNVNNIITVYESTMFNNSALYAGALYSYSAVLNATRNSFTTNSAIENGGAMAIKQGTTTVTDCTFTHNKAHNGGSISSMDNSIVMVENSTFAFNNATNDAGGITGAQNMVIIRNSHFKNNTAKWAGAIAAYENSTITMEKCNFMNNRAKWGGALASYQGTLIVNRSRLMHQEATKQGGVVYCHMSLLIIEKCLFSNNRAMKDGGALTGVGATLNILHGTDFQNNEAKYYGAVIHWTNGAIHMSGKTMFDMNTAQKGVVYLYDTTANFTGNTTFTQNHGSLYTVNSHVTFTGIAVFENCSSDPSPEKLSTTKRTTTTEISRLEGGALTITFESTVTFNGRCSFISNHAKVGGGFIITESEVYFNGESLIANNAASDTGGGIYLYQSELTCKKECNLLIHNNSAGMRGGGVHAFSSLIKVTNPQSTIKFIENRAEMGGGICLEMDTKIYILKTDANSTNAISFISNSAATHGGAIHVIDGPHSCTSPNILPYITNECFLQTIKQYYDNQPSYMINELVTDISLTVTSNYTLAYFYNNTAGSGSSIYGGLISSCTISQSNIAQNHPHSSTTITTVNGTSYISSISNIQLNSISSDPIQICACREGWPDCSYQPCPIKVMKGGFFTASVAAVDQANQPVSATVFSSFKSAENDLMKHLFIVNKDRNSVCTDLTFTSKASGNSSDELILHVEGPCKDAELSKLRFDIDFYSCSECPIGFEPQTSSERCECTCDSSLKPFVVITRCNSSTGTLLRETNFWLTYLNDSDAVGYLFYEFCPMDYCQTPITELNLNIPGGSDAQCAFNRIGLLCGSCQPGLSLSLGSSECLPCPGDWLAVYFVPITLAALLAGIALCIIILVLNLTVAVGTINGVIFYANIIAASYSTFLPKPQPNFASIIISSLNFELGFNICYIKGMDTYTKTWLQLAFPLYVFILVSIIIKVSQYSSKFSNLIGKKNPVATLSTLTLLSYTKILSTTISALSFATLHYPNGSVRYVWRPDASVEYLKGKHIPMFVTAVIILLLGFAYTMLLFSWQWILYGQQWKILKWTRNSRLNLFIETYHAPFSGKHRYWVGLLLIVRSALYLVAVTNNSGNPRTVLAATAFTIGCLLFLKASIALRVYKDWIIDSMETFLYFNIIMLCTFMWFTLDTNREQTPVAYISIVITFIQLLVIVSHHIFKGVCKRTKKVPDIEHNVFELQENNNVRQLFNQDGTDRLDDICEFLDADDRQRPVGRVGYQMTRTLSLINHTTQSVIEFPRPESTTQLQCETYNKQEDDIVPLLK